MACIFCKIVDGEIAGTVVKEMADVIVIPDINPQAPIHYLIIPKIHIDSMIDFDMNNQKHAAIAKQMFSLTRELALELKDPKAFNIVANNGSEAGQSVKHLHWHFLAGKNIYDTVIKL